MKSHALLAAIALGVIGLTVTPAHAQTADPCQSFTCMSAYTGPGSGAATGCTAGDEAFFSVSLYIYDEESVDWPATALNRAVFLNKCSGVVDNPNNVSIAASIIEKFGTRAQ